MMHSKKRLLFLITVFLVGVYYSGYFLDKQAISDKDLEEFQKELVRQQESKEGSERSVRIVKIKVEIHVSLACCGDRVEEAMNMLKSAVMFTQTPMHFHIFAEDQLQEQISYKLNNWPTEFRQKFSFTMYSLAFPAGDDHDEWKEMYLTCSSQRLFMPDILKHLDSVLYVDTDLLFLRPLENIWSFFKEFNKKQLMGMTLYHELNTAVARYRPFAQHPFYGLNGVNSGVLLMNLTRIRAFNMTNRIIQIYKEYKTKIEWGDQDILNILFHFQPEYLYVCPYEWNIRPISCRDGLNYHGISDHGVAIIHGCEKTFHNKDEPSFSAIYDAFNKYELGADVENMLIKEMQRRLSEPNVISMNCTTALWTPVIKSIRKSARAVSSRISVNLYVWGSYPSSS